MRKFLLAFILMLFSAVQEFAATHDVYGRIEINKGTTFNLLSDISSNQTINSIEVGIGLNKGKGAWQLEIATQTNDTLIIKVARQNHNLGEIDHKSFYEITALLNDSIIGQKQATTEIDTGGRCNFLKTVVSNNELEIWFGRRFMFLQFKSALPEIGKITSANVSADRSGYIQRRVLGFNREKPRAYTRMDDPKKELPDSTVWNYLDMEMDYDFGRRGGDYKLLMRKALDGTLELLYVNGAITNSTDWEPGDLKAKLEPEVINGNYHLTWYDAERNSYFPEAYAIIEGNLMTLYFPLSRSQLRFIRTL